MQIDRFLPQYDSIQVVEVDVDAPMEETWNAVLETDLRDPVIDALFALRELPLRLRGKRKALPGPTSGPVTFGRVATAGGWTVLADMPQRELVIGAIGRFWEQDYGNRAIAASDFVPFQEPGYAKLAISLLVSTAPFGQTRLRYEARTATTDDAAARTFRRYWRVIHPGVAIVMHRALIRIRREAERRAAPVEVGGSVMPGL